MTPTHRDAAAAATDTVTVELGDRSYPIIIGSGVRAEAGPRLAALTATRRAAVVTNATVGRLYLDGVVASLTGAGFDVVTVEIPDGESHKNLASLATIYDALLAARIDRATPVLALGGGIVGDVTGFAAATLLRGVPFVQMPTTLLSQVDSSVGGKTGINHAAGKNLIGAFYQPRLVLIDLDTLRSLPRRELLAGLAEVIKYGIILAPDLFAAIETQLDGILALDAAVLRPIIARCCALKAEVVRRDERETDYRSILNFGHTLGHAVEALTHYNTYLHGEAVAIGMAFAVKFSQLRGHCEDPTMHRVIELLRRAGLPVEIPAVVRGADLTPVLESDKKVAGGRVKFVCIEALGRTRFEYVSAGEIAAAVR
jgi:3-dehydroquinate synthase